MRSEVLGLMRVRVVVPRQGTVEVEGSSCRQNTSSS